MIRKMKKYESVYFLEIRRVIYKFLVLMAVTTVAFLVLFYSKGYKFAGYGFELMCHFAYLDKVTILSGVGMLLLMFIVPWVQLRGGSSRYKLLKVTADEVKKVGFAAHLTMWLMWYVCMMLEFILVAWLFTMDPSYTGGENGILFSFVVMDVTRWLIPVMMPVRFLLNIGVLAVLSLITGIPYRHYMNALQKEKINEY